MTGPLSTQGQLMSIKFAPFCLSASLRLALATPLDHVAVALVGAAQGAQLVGYGNRRRHNLG
jgi:hypothetical protein